MRGFMAPKSGDIFLCPWHSTGPVWRCEHKLYSSLVTPHSTGRLKVVWLIIVQVGIVMQIQLCERWFTQSCRKVVVPRPCLMNCRQKMVQGKDSWIMFSKMVPSHVFDSSLILFQIQRSMSVCMGRWKLMDNCSADLWVLSFKGIPFINFRCQFLMIYIVW